MKSYVDELKKPDIYNPETWEILCQHDNNVDIGFQTNVLNINLEKGDIESIVGDHKASFVEYNGVPYKK